MLGIPLPFCVSDGGVSTASNGEYDSVAVRPFCIFKLLGKVFEFDDYLVFVNLHILSNHFLSSCKDEFIGDVTGSVHSSNASKGRYAHACHILLLQRPPKTL